MPEKANKFNLICGTGCVGLFRNTNDLECACQDGYYDPNILGNPDCKSYYYNNYYLLKKY